MNPCCAARLLTVSALLAPVLIRAAAWITWCNRLWAHTNRFGDAFGTYKLTYQTSLAELDRQYFDYAGIALFNTRRDALGWFWRLGYGGYEILP